MPKLTDIIADLYTGTNTKEDAATNSTTTFLTWTHNSTGAVAAGFGIRHIWKLESSTTPSTDAAFMDVRWTDHVHASRSSQVRWTLLRNALDQTIYLGTATYASGTTTYGAAIGVGIEPSGAGALHLSYAHPEAFSIMKAFNSDTTDDNGIVFSFRTTTTGVGASATAEVGGFRVMYRQHDHPTRLAHVEFYIANAAAFEVWKFREGFTVGYGDLTEASFTRLLATRKTGWAVATGAATRTTFDTATVTLPQLAERVKALIDDLHQTAGHGLIGT